jgi:parvulin-like peptidyl-prolyl isomerase
MNRQEAIIGQAGKEFITEEEFIDRFELTPGLYRHKGGRLDEEKLITMYSLIAEKLLAQEAEERGLGLDTLVANAARKIAEDLARDELYRKEVVEKVVVTEKEVNTEAVNALQTLILQFIFFPDEHDALFVRSHIDGRNLTDVEVDSTMRSLKDTVSVTWGMAEWSVEKAAYGLHQGEVSPVVKASNGYYILQLVRKSRNSPYARMTDDVRRERVRGQIRLRKEEARLQQFMVDFLRDRTAYAVSRHVKALALAMSNDLVQKENDEGFVLNRKTVDSLKGQLAPILDDTMMVAGERWWTVRNFIDRLSASGFTASSREPLEIANTLNSKCLVWTEQALLADEAIRRGLDRTPSVLQQVKEWRTSLLARAMRQQVEDSVSVTDADVFRYVEQNGQPLPTPRVQIRELKISSTSDIQRAVEDITMGAPFDQVVRRYSADAAARERGGLTGFFRITERPPIGDIAGAMSVGQIYGPIRSADGFLLFQLVARQDSVREDTSLAGRQRAAAEELARLMRKSRLDQFIVKSAARRGYSLFPDRLHALAVSPIPTLTFRVLGFGGRMFAVPLVPRLFDWVNIEVPKPEVVP